MKYWVSKGEGNKKKREAMPFLDFLRSLKMRKEGIVPDRRSL
jgi:hypothetical protein